MVGAVRVVLVISVGGLHFSVYLVVVMVMLLVVLTVLVVVW